MLSTSASNLPPDPALYRAYVMRHGESWGQIRNTAYKELGDCSVPVTEWGYEQTVRAGKFFGNLAQRSNFEPYLVIASTCLRTQQSAAGVIEGIISTAGHSALLFPKALQDARLKKQEFGHFDGLFDDTEKAQRFPNEFKEYATHIANHGIFGARPPQGESLADVHARASEFACDIQENRFGTKNLIIVTHGTVAACIEAALVGRSKDWILDRIDKAPNCHTRRISKIGERADVDLITYTGANRPSATPEIGKAPYWSKDLH